MDSLVLKALVRARDCGFSFSVVLVGGLYEVVVPASYLDEGDFGSHTYRVLHTVHPDGRVE